METMPTPTRKEIITLFETWIKQRPGLEWCNYDCGNYRDSLACYRSEMRSITKDRHRALKALDYFERDIMPFDFETLLKCFRSAYSGRLSLEYNEKKGYYLSYCTGQYWPTEYRKAAATVLEDYEFYMRRKWEQENEVNHE